MLGFLLDGAQTNCQNIGITVSIIVIGCLNTLVFSFFKLKRRFSSLKQPTRSNITILRKVLKYEFIETIIDEIYNKEILKAYQHFKYTKLGHIFALKFVFEVASDVLHVFYRQATIGNTSIETLPLVIFLVLSSLDTLVKMALISRKNSLEVDFIVSVLLFPVVSFLEFVYFDRLIDSSELEFGLFLTLFDFFRLLAEF